jgi:hypothetical protein
MLSITTLCHYAVRLCWVSQFINYNAECCYAECCCAPYLSINICVSVTLSIMGLFVTLSINDTQHNNNLQWVPLYWISHFIYCNTKCHYEGCIYAGCAAEWHYDKCHYAGWMKTRFNIILSNRTKPVACTVNSLKSFDNSHEWCLYYKWVIALASPLARVVNSDHKWCSKL